MENYEKFQSQLDKGKKTFIEILKLGNEGYPLHVVLENIDDGDILAAVKEYKDQFENYEF